jgi:hypothetical protein
MEFSEEKKKAYRNREREMMHYSEYGCTAHAHERSYERERALFAHAHDER